MQLAEVLKTLSIDLEIDDEAIITDLLVVAKVQRVNGTTTVARATTDGSDWITLVGLSTICHKMTMDLMQDYEGENG